MIAPESHHRVFLIATSGVSVPVRVSVNKRATRVSVRIDPNAREAVATAPAQRYALDAISLASERVDWIAERLGALPPPMTFQPGAHIPLRGVVHQLCRSDSGRSVRIETSGAIPMLLVPGSLESFRDKTHGFFRAAARTDIAERVAAHAGTLKVSPKSIAIKDTRSRWGSCSSDGRLNFSWLLVCAPPFALDYVAAHEVAHLKEMNHSARFWRQVERCVPDWRRARRWLEERGQALHAIGDI